MLRVLHTFSTVGAVMMAAALLGPTAARAVPYEAAATGEAAAAAAVVRGRVADQGPMTPRIHGGTLIPSAEAPWQVILVGANFLCGGSILNERTVLTAAHCTTRLQPGGRTPASGGLEVIAGTADVSASPPETQRALMQSFRVHPYYNAAGPVATTGDIAVLTLATPLNLTASPAVKAIALPAAWAPTSSKAPVPKDLRVTGYGLTEEVGGGERRLRSMATTVADSDTCGISAENAVAICARSPLGSSCQGDSGGPLVTTGPNPVQVGVVSNGPRCGASTDDLYVNLLAPENRVFIDSALAGTDVAPPKAPRGTADPQLSGPASFRAGDTVTCGAGAFSNAPTEIRIEFTKDDGTVLQSTVGPTAQLRLPDAAVGSHLTCRPYATNAGGTYVGGRYTTTATVGAGPAGSTPAGAGGIAAQCPTSLGAAATFPATVSAPRTARPGGTLVVTIRRSGPPSAAHFVVAGITGPRHLVVGGSAEFASTGAASRDAELQEYVKVRIRIPRSLRVGKRYRFRGTMVVANSVEEIRAGGICEYGSQPFSVRIVR